MLWLGNTLKGKTPTGTNYFREVKIRESGSQSELRRMLEALKKGTTVGVMFIMSSCKSTAGLQRQYRDRQDENGEI